MIIITEVNSKIKSNISLESENNICGYTLYSVNISVPHKRGVIVFVDKDLFSGQLDVHSFFSEFNFISFNNIVGDKFTNGAFYRSPSSTSDNDRYLLELIVLPQKCNIRETPSNWEFQFPRYWLVKLQDSQFKFIFSFEWFYYMFRWQFLDAKCSASNKSTWFANSPYPGFNHK